MTPVFLLVYSLTFVWGGTSVESAFKNSSHLTENDERAEIFQKHIKLDVKNRTDATVALLFVGVVLTLQGRRKV